MRVIEVALTNYKSHAATGPIALGPITVLVGPNNAGKSSILQALFGLQQSLEPDGLRRGESHGEITMRCDGLEEGIPSWGIQPNTMSDARVRIDLPPSGGNYVLVTPDGERGAGPFTPVEPHHFVIPFLSKRKVAGYSENVRLSETQAVRGDLHHLPARLSRLSNPANPRHARYAEACKRILGSLVTNVPSANGQRSGVYLENDQTIYLEAMGEGVPQIVGLIVELVEAKGKLFLIEELENDLHPSALKELLSLILASSEENQFVVTTHSHIVTRYLGSADGSRVYNVSVARGVQPPLAEVEPIETPEARVRILRELGYELSDFDLWDAWLILEESSAERIIRDFLIPWFVPQLQGRVRTMAVGGTGNIEPSVEDFRRMFLFTHLEHAYRERSWVVVDGDDSGKKVVERLQKIYGRDWPPEHFIALQQTAFEHYYPDGFAKKAKAALGVTDRKGRQDAKKELLEEVLQWCREHPEQARKELADSAKEVISVLETIVAGLAS